MSETQKIKQLKAIQEELEIQIENLQNKLRLARDCAGCMDCEEAMCPNWL